MGAVSEILINTSMVLPLLPTPPSDAEANPDLPPPLPKRILDARVPGPALHDRYNSDDTKRPSVPDSLNCMN